MSEIRWFSGNFQPKSWAYCQGQLLSIAQNQALFSLLGVTYGGNGIQTFALPDFRSRIAVGTGNNTEGVQSYSLGEVGGTPNVTLSQNNLPAHNHIGAATITIPASSESDNSPEPTGNYLAGGLTGLYNNTTNTPDATMAQHGGTVVVSNAGNNMPLNIEQPYLAVNFIICLYGIYPSRN
jgi:microcystin-dependent protein